METKSLYKECITPNNVHVPNTMNTCNSKKQIRKECILTKLNSCLLLINNKKLNK